MSNQDKDLTIGQLCDIIKKSFSRSLIYVIITVVCLSAVLFTVKGFTDTKVFSTTLVFSDVKESQLSGLNANKAFVLDRATSDKNNPSLGTILLPDLSVAAKIPEGEAAGFISNTYVISLKFNKKTELTSNEYKNILDNVANEYVRSFSATLQTLPFNYYESELASSEYIHHILNLSETIDGYIKILENELVSFDNLSDFAYENKSGDKKSVADLLSELTVTRSTLSRLTQTVITNKIEKTEGGLVDYLTYARDTANAKVAKLSDSLRESELVLEKYKNVIGTVKKDENGNNIYYYDDANFMKLSLQHIALAKELGEATEKSNSLQTYIDYLDNTKTENGVTTPLPAEEKHSFPDKTSDTYISLEKAIGGNGTGDEGLIKKSFLSIKNSVNFYNDLAEKYNKTQTVTAEITRIDDAHSATESTLGVKTIVFILIAAAIISFIVAVSQTYSKTRQERV